MEAMRNLTKEEEELTELKFRILDNFYSSNEEILLNVLKKFVLGTKDKNVLNKLDDIYYQITEC